jgi:Peptidase family M48
MKKNKKITYYLIIAALVLAGIVVTQSTNLNNTLRTQQHGHKTMMSAEEFYNQELEQEHEKVWQEFTKIGISKQRYQEARKRLYQKYVRSDIPFTNKKVSPQTEQFVKTVMKECGLNPNKVKIAGYNDRSPAAATEQIIYVNEQIFSAMSESAKRFVIGHEIQHILHGDNSARYILETLAGNETENLAPKKPNHPLLQYSRFKERRADIKTALQGQEWSKAYLAFAKERLEKCGDTPGVTHPKHSDRFKLAQAIHDHMQNDQKYHAIKTV